MNRLKVTAMSDDAIDKPLLDGVLAALRHGGWTDGARRLSEALRHRRVTWADTESPHGFAFRDRGITLRLRRHHASGRFKNSFRVYRDLTGGESFVCRAGYISQRRPPIHVGKKPSQRRNKALYLSEEEVTKLARAFGPGWRDVSRARLDAAAEEALP